LKPSDQDLLSIIKEAIDKYILDHINKKEKLEFIININEDTIIYTSENMIKEAEINIKGSVKEKSKLFHQDTMKILINYELCNNCQSLRGGGTFVSIIQLRVKNETYLSIIDKALDQIYTLTNKRFNNDQRQYIAKIIDQKYGLDLYISTKNLTNWILRHIEAHYHFIRKESRKLVGRNTQEGKNIYRKKFLIKFLPVKTGEVIKIGINTFNVENILKKKVILKSERNEKIIKPYNWFFQNDFKKVKR
jgi:NMD protein affecting ribosome stability and mRNA decay